MKRCYELAISDGKKGYDILGAVLVHKGVFLKRLKIRQTMFHKIFGHAEFDLVHKCADKYSDEILENPDEVKKKQKPSTVTYS